MKSLDVDGQAGLCINLRGQTKLVLRTPRIVLRWFTAADAGFIVEPLNDPGWKKFIGKRGVRTGKGWKMCDLVREDHA